MSIVPLLIDAGTELVASAGHLPGMDEQALAARFARRELGEPVR